MSRSWAKKNRNFPVCLYPTLGSYNLSPGTKSIGVLGLIIINNILNTFFWFSFFGGEGGGGRGREDRGEGVRGRGDPICLYHVLHPSHYYAYFSCFFHFFLFLKLFLFLCFARVTEHFPFFVQQNKEEIKS